MLFDSEDVGRKRLGLVRSATILGYDAISACVGLAVALHVHADAAAAFSSALVMVVVLRLLAGLSMRLDRWSFAGARGRYALRFVIALLLGSAAVRLALPGLPASAVVLEGAVTGLAMAALRLAPVVLDLLFTRNLPPAQAQFVRLERARRILNVVVALTGLVLTLPVWALIALAIKLTSRGPVFYKQERVGLDLRASRPHVDDPRRKVDLGGRPFMMLKFRTMRVDAESGTGAVWSSGKADPRVTSIGRILRQTRLDELPQLINVLKGDMNVVGPRPERAPILVELREKVPNYTFRQRARPGITGFAQVNLEADLTVEDVADKVQYDVAYIRNASVFVDLFIMLKTVPVMLFRDRILRQKTHREAKTPVPAPRPVEGLVRTQG